GLVEVRGELAECGQYEKQRDRRQSQASCDDGECRVVGVTKDQRQPGHTDPPEGGWGGNRHDRQHKERGPCGELPRREQHASGAPDGHSNCRTTKCESPRRRRQGPIEDEPDAGGMRQQVRQRGGGERQEQYEWKGRQRREVFASRSNHNPNTFVTTASIVASFRATSL